MQIDNSICQLRVLAKRSKDLSPLSQQKTLVYVFGPLDDVEGLHTSIFGSSANTVDALCYVNYFMFDLLRSLILICNFYLEVEE